MTRAADLDDATLVQRCRNGDAAAWAAVVRRYQRLVYAVAMRSGLDEHGAADIFQTVFARLHEHLDRLTQPERLQAWLVTTAKREVLHARRLGRRSVSMTGDGDGDGPADGIADDAPLAEDALAHLQQLDLVRRGLDAIDARCRDLLTLLFRDEDDRVAYDDIAARLGIPVGSIGPTRARCLGKLRRQIEGPESKV